MGEGHPSPSGAGVGLFGGSQRRPTASGPRATDRQDDTEPARKTGQRDCGVSSGEPTGWCPLLKMYLAPVVWGECPLAAPSWWWRAQSRGQPPPAGGVRAVGGGVPDSPIARCPVLPGGVYQPPARAAGCGLLSLSMREPLSVRNPVPPGPGYFPACLDAISAASLWACGCNKSKPSLGVRQARAPRPLGCASSSQTGCAGAAECGQCGCMRGSPGRRPLAASPAGRGLPETAFSVSGHPTSPEPS